MALLQVRQGPPMIPDAIPHALSLLQAVLPAPDASVDDVSIRAYGEAGERLDVTFVYRAGGRAVEARVDLRRARTQPRVAAYGFDGLLARREVRMEGYRLSLIGGNHRLDLPDPTPRLVQTFLARVSSSDAANLDPNAWPGMAMLETVHDAWSHVAVLPASAAGPGIE